MEKISKTAGIIVGIVVLIIGIVGWVHPLLFKILALNDVKLVALPGWLPQLLVDFSKGVVLLVWWFQVGLKVSRWKEVVNWIDNSYPSGEGAYEFDKKMNTAFKVISIVFGPFILVGFVLTYLFQSAWFFINETIEKSVGFLERKEKKEQDLS
jgi:hypothetical protein